MKKLEKKNLTVTIREKSYDIPFNTTISEVLNKYCPDNKKNRFIAALYHNRLYGLTTPIRSNSTLEPISRHDRIGLTVYRRSASLILVEAVRRLYPDAEPVIGQSIHNGYYYSIKGFENGIKKEIIEEIQTEMQKIVDEDLPFSVESRHVDNARKMLLEQGNIDKANLLKIHWNPQVRIVKCGGTYDLFHDPFAPSTSYIDTFKVESYWPGMVLRFPARGKDSIPKDLTQLPKLFQTYIETRQWNEMLGIKNLGQLNGEVLNGNISSIVKVSEGLQEKNIVSIANTISQKRPDIKLVLIAGPSSSGKTTFSKRLAVQLQVNGIRPMTMEMDNFFVERDKTPRDEKGDYDFESIDAIDIELFNDVLNKLMDGETAKIPIFDFKKGGKLPEDKWIPKKLDDDQVLIIEGIHGLNDKLTEHIMGHRKFKIYISALTQLCIDDHNRIFTSDTRLIRRIVRDRNFRGYSAENTILRWDSVRRGEMKHIFPFQEKADIMFNSALLYEPGVLKTICERALLEVPQDSPAFPVAFRLLRFFRLVAPISKSHIPSNSIVREFLGDSSFHY